MDWLLLLLFRDLCEERADKIYFLGVALRGTSSGGGIRPDLPSKSARVGSTAARHR